MERQVKSISLSNFHFLFLTSNPSDQDLIHVEFKIFLSHYMSALICCISSVYQKSSISRRNSIIRPMRPGKQFKSCLVSYKYCCCSLTFMMQIKASLMFMYVSSKSLIILKRTKNSATSAYTLHVCQAHFSHEMPTQCHVHLMCVM